MPIEKLRLNEQNKRMLHFFFGWFFFQIEVLWENMLLSSVEMLKREITWGQKWATCQDRLSVLIIFLSKSNKSDDD